MGVIIGEIMKNMNYGEWLRNWLNIYKKPYVKTWKTIQRNIELHIPNYILKMKLINLSAFDIQKALNNVKSSRMRIELFDIYHGSLQMAYKVGFLENDISAALIKPKHMRKLGSALTPGELQVFLYRIQHTKLESFFKFCLLTGCRRSEALSVTWNDIDFIKGLIHIRGTKTELSDRFIPIFSELYLVFNSIPQNSFKLFNFRKDYVTHKFKEYCPNHKLHDLRHTFATRCIECGINIKVVQSWLGHSRLDTTSSIYTHLLPEFINSESEKFKLF